jgi:cytoskeletal protein RodZ
VSDPSEPTTLGAYLREARRRKRVSLERAAEQTRIRADFLMRMESDDFDFLAPAYVRGFLSSYARFLGVQIEPLIEEFDRRFGTGNVDTAQMIAMDRKRVRGSGERRIGPLAIVLFAAAGILLLFAVIGLAAGDGDNENGQVAINPTETPTPTETTPIPSVTETPTPTITFTQPSEPEPEETTVPIDGALELVLVAERGESWATITLDEAPIFNELIPEGEFRTFFAEEGEDLHVTLGDAAQVDIVVNGEQLPRQKATLLEFTLPDQLDLLGA